MSETPTQPTPSSVTVAAVQSRIGLSADAVDFRRQMARQVEGALAHAPDLIVFPEYIGTGLVALGSHRAEQADSFDGAMLQVALSNIRRVIRPLLKRMPLSCALLTAMSAQMREVYVEVFSELAATHRVFIAAGSIVLPHEGDDSGRVYNTFHLFGPDGAVLDTADKVNLIDMEAARGLHLTPGAREDMSVWRTPIGSFAPLICLDAWDTELAARLVADGAQMLLVPSADLAPWNEAERREGMFSRVRELGVPGVEAFAVGRLAGIAFEGRSWILTPDASASDGVRIVAQAGAVTEPGIVGATVELAAAAADDSPRPPV